MKHLHIIGIAALGLIISTWIAGSAYRAKFSNARIITVTGLAEKEFTSDKVIWTGSYTRKSMDQTAAYAAIKSDEQMIKAFLEKKNIQQSEINFSGIRISRDYENRANAEKSEYTNVFTGFVMQQSVTITSKDIARVEQVSKEVTELISNGIELNSSEPDYYYTKLSDVKMELLANASADAKKRAETIAKNAGQSLGQLRTASMGIFQIAGRDSNEDFSSGGIFNTSDVEKKGSITMRVEYYVK